MNKRLNTALLAVTAGAILTGCSGPTKTGIENRKAAHARLDAFNAQVTYQQAEQSFQVGELDKALEEITAVVQAVPDRADYRVLQGRIYMEMHQLQNALDAFAAASEADPTNAEAPYYAGIAHERWSDDQSAYEAYTRAFEADSNNVQYLLAASETLVAMDRLPQAQALVNEHLTRFENNAALLHLLGQIARMQDDPASAAQYYSQARLLRPDDDALAQELAWVQFAAGQYGRCLSTVQDVQRRQSEPRPDLMHLQARCLALTERVADARNLYVELTKAKADDPEVWIELGMICWDLGDYRRVAQCSVQAIALAPDRYEGYLLKGANERERGNLENAAKLFQQASERAPSETLPHLMLGLTFEQAGQSDLALQAYRSALSVDPENTEANTLLTRLENATQVTAATTDDAPATDGSPE